VSIAKVEAATVGVIPISLITYIQELPRAPGCYLFKDVAGQILYVGKSKHLRKRVSSYFGASYQRDEKFNVMVRHVASIDHVCTDTDIEALLLEHRLIKKYRPPYNAKMRKDMEHWYIKIDMDQPYPGLTIVSEKWDVQNTFIGNFRRRESAEAALLLISEYWRLPTCGLASKNRKASCLRYQIKQCVGSCAGHINPEKYQSIIDDAIDFFRGNFKPVLDNIIKLIQDASQTLAFERAAHLRNQYEGLQMLSKQFSHIPPELVGRDYYLLLKSRHEDCFLWVYLKNKTVRAWIRVNSIEEWNAKAGTIMQHIADEPINPVSVNYITFDDIEGLRLMDAILEVEAIRFYIDIASRPEDIKQQVYNLLTGM